MRKQRVSARVPTFRQVKPRRKLVPARSGKGEFGHLALPWPPVWVSGRYSQLCRDCYNHRDRYGITGSTKMGFFVRTTRRTHSAADAKRFRFLTVQYLIHN